MGDEVIIINNGCPCGLYSECQPECILRWTKAQGPVFLTKEQTKTHNEERTKAMLHLRPDPVLVPPVHHDRDETFLRRPGAPTVRDDPRMGGAVVRYHTWPTIQRQTVADHSWNVVRILHAIWPDAPSHVVEHALYHDVGEVATGDPPWPVKADNPRMKETFDRLESEARRGMVIPWDLPPERPLMVYERVILKLCDTIEMWEFGLSELMLGNQFARLIVVRQAEVAERMIGEVNNQVFQEHASRYMQKRRATWEV